MNKSQAVFNEHEDHKMIKIEVNLDDMPGEWLGYVMEKMFEIGANDVYYIPIYMKKNRPGTLMHILCSKTKLREVEKILFRETTTLGIRYYQTIVHRLARRFETIDTKYGNVRVKIGMYAGEVVQWAPEYEDCKKIAMENNVPLKEVYEEVRILAVEIGGFMKS